MKHDNAVSMCLVFLLLFWSLPAIAQSQGSRKPALIRDTDVAEGKDNTDATKPKEPNSKLAEINIDIGNFYLKKRNFSAAIQRYIEAIEYQPNSTQAYDALARAYEKKGDKDKAIETYKGFIKKYPNSPQCDEFRAKLAKLEKK
jgi:tetratricopeptide (TPR) repeat protein